MPGARILPCASLIAALALPFPTGIAHAAALKTIYSFTASLNTAGPTANLVLDFNGAIYGTTRGAYGYGTVFKLVLPGTIGGAWRESVLYRFCQRSACADGATPLAGLFRSTDSVLYGTTLSGGASANFGAVFKVTPCKTRNLPYSFPMQCKTEQVLYSFTGGTDGSSPVSRLISPAPGVLYGTTSEGGAYGYGTAFELQGQ